ncbi:hypothetical protein E1293_42945 [Actinomadura darangshiensis]|uniref:DUF2804 domain-containing protein n=1 Tax=Actinomadura darangshiensis TaxID=705336 RepID=A0A4R4ZYY0_9ACTN|nr:hypothetical protein [Actinomadura darangshiensis]TDD63586.1 hypothetical protein E1293_42945 [Actinomadura darangshiensis]
MARIIEHGTWNLEPADEDLHAPGPETLWNESYYFDFAAPDGSIAGYVRLGLYPNWDRAWYWAALVRQGEPLLLVADNDAPLPKPGTADVRTGAYTATQRITEPFGPAEVTLDGTASILPDPTAAYGDHAAAETTRLTFDLRWDTVSGVYPYKDIPRYEIPCTVSGTVTAGGETIAIDAHGERDHSWGERDWWKVSWLWTSGRLGDGTFVHGMQANVGFPLPWPCFAVPPGGEIEHRDGFTAETSFAAGLPARSRLRYPGAPMTVTPVAFAPVAVTSPDGRPARFPRALCRFEAEDGRSGHGWTEWHQPPGWEDHGWTHLAEDPA